MKKALFVLLAVILLPACKKVCQEPQVKSPNGTLSVAFRLADGCPQYRVIQDSMVVIDWSALGLQCEDADLTGGFNIACVYQSDYQSEWETVWGEERTIIDKHNEMAVGLQHRSGRLMNIVFRAFDDGFAFRYEFPISFQTLRLGKRLTITDEATEYRFTSDPEAWSIPWRTEYYEGLWTKIPLSAQSDTMCSPVTLELVNGGYALVHEAALVNYPAQNLYMQDGALCTYLTPWLDSTAHTMAQKAYEEVPFVTPWRMVIMAHNLPEMVASRIMLNLNEPCKIKNTSWIKPMKFIGIWWGMHMKSMTWEQGPVHGATTENMERYMRFAHDHHIEAVLAEGWNKGWEDWQHFSFTEPYDDWNMDYLSRLSDSLGVAIIGHNETGGNAADYENVLDEAYTYHAKYGIHAIKTGYVAPIIRTVEGLQWNKGQAGVRHYRKVIEKAAKYHICIDNHEPVMPTGLQRTYPNLMTQEGVRGQEWNAWSADGGSPCEHVTVLPFSRIMAGPVDYTPGVFAFENPAMPGTRVHATLANQLALFVVLYSPLQMACDLPENYMKHPDAFRFIEEVPCDWEQSRLLDGRIGDYVVMARQGRGTDDWFVGAVTDENSRDISLPMDFLKQDATYRITVYADGEDADWQTAPYSMNIYTRNCSAKDTLRLHLAPGGGCAMSIQCN